MTVPAEIDLAEEIQEIDAAETPAETPADDAAVEPEPEAEPEEELPEKYRGKSVAEMARILEDREHTIGRQGDELGQLRQRAVTAEPEAEPAKVGPISGAEYVRQLWDDVEVRNEAYPQFDLAYNTAKNREQRALKVAGYDGVALEEELAKVDGDLKFEAWASALPGASREVNSRRERERAEVPARIKTHAQRIATTYGVTEDEVTGLIGTIGADGYLHIPESNRPAADRFLAGAVIGLRQINQNEGKADEEPQTRATAALSTTGTVGASAGSRVTQAELNIAKHMFPELKSTDDDGKEKWDEDSLRELAISHKKGAKR